MKLFKLIITLIIFLSLCLPSLAEKRKPRLSMKELTDRNSPTYVPYPYPKNKKELLADIKYYYIDMTAGASSSYVGKTPISKIIIADLFGPNSNYKVGKIFKVKNRIAEFPDEYLWLVYIMDSDNDAVMNISVMECGLVIGGGAINKKALFTYPEETRKKLKKAMKVKEKKDVKKFLSDFLGNQIEDKDIKKIERVAYLSTLGSFNSPMWEFTMKDGIVYYYSEKRDMVYEIDERIPWKKISKKGRQSIRDFVSHRDYLPDTISDELLTLKRAKKRKKQ